MPAADLPSLETRLEARLIELERLYEARPRMSDALGRAGAGQRLDELLDEIAELQQEIMLSPAVTLQDAAVKLRRLSVYPGGPGARAATGGSAGGRRAGGDELIRLSQRALGSWRQSRRLAWRRLHTPPSALPSGC